MPFKSKAQQGYLYMHEPKVAKEFASHMSKSDFKALPYKAVADKMKKKRKKGANKI